MTIFEDKDFPRGQQHRRQDIQWYHNYHRNFVGGGGGVITQYADWWTEHKVQYIGAQFCKNANIDDVVYVFDKETGQIAVMESSRDEDLRRHF